MAGHPRETVNKLSLFARSKTKDRGCNAMVRAENEVMAENVPFFSPSPLMLFQCLTYPEAASQEPDPMTTLNLTGKS